MVKKQSNQHGGPRPGSGRPKLPKGEKRLKVAITMTPEHYKATAGGNRSAIIEQALDAWTKSEPS